MSLLTLPFKLPLLPLKGVIQLAELIRDQADEELHDPAAVRRQLEAVEEAERAGKLSPEDAAAAEQQAISRVIGTVDPGRPDDEPLTRS
jgi:hypothetical protein